MSVTTTTSKEDIPIVNIPVGSSVSSGIKMLQTSSPVVVKAEIKRPEL